MAKYTVQSPVKHGGKIHDIDATITLDDDAAAPLLALGRITAKGGTKNSSDDASSTEGNSEDSRDAARQAAKSKEPAPGASTSAPAKKSGGKK